MLCFGSGSVLGVRIPDLDSVKFCCSPGAEINAAWAKNLCFFFLSLLILFRKVWLIVILKGTPVVLFFLFTVNEMSEVTC